MSDRYRIRSAMKRHRLGRSNSNISITNKIIVPGLDKTCLSNSDASDIENLEKFNDEESKEHDYVKSKAPDNSNTRRRDKKLANKQIEESSIVAALQLVMQPVVSELKRLSAAIEKVGSILETHHTSVPLAQYNMNDNQAIVNNQPIPQSDDEHHIIEEPEVLEELYPYKKWIKDELPDLEPESKKYYKEMLRLAENIEPLAYFFWLKRDMQRKTKINYLNIYKQCMDGLGKFDITKIRSKFIETDMKNDKVKSTLKRNGIK